AASTAPPASSRIQRQSKASLDIWHDRLGHARREALLHLPQSSIGVAPFPSSNFERETDLCRTCALANNKQQISRVPPSRGSYPFEKSHFDLIYLETAFNADKYILHFYCAFSGYHLTYTLTNKGEVEFARSTQHFLALTERWGYKVRILQTDGEKALGHQWNSIIYQHGITVQPSPTDTQSQNGYAERSGGVIIDMARRIHIASQLP
ncbi:hypothetical protein K402DRAFT_310467, partial [Aulographum hederae CBS 113979]